MVDGAFLTNTPSRLTFGPNRTLQLASGNAPGSPYYDQNGKGTTLSFAAGDDVYAILDIASSSSITVTGPSGWTLVNETAFSDGKVQLWHYGKATSSTWADVPRTFTVSAACFATCYPIAVRGSIADDFQYEIFGTTSSPVTPTLNAATTSGVFVIGYVLGRGSGSGGAQIGPDYYPGGLSSQNGWQEIVGNSQGTYPTGLHGNSGTLPATLPSFNNDTNAANWVWIVFSIRDTTSSGWSVGQIKY